MEYSNSNQHIDVNQIEYGSAANLTVYIDDAYEIDATLRQFQNVVGIYMTTCVIIIGLIANIMAIVSLKCSSIFTDSTSYLLRVLGAADIVLLLTRVLTDVCETICANTDWIGTPEQDDSQQISSADVWSLIIYYSWPLSDLSSKVVKWIVTVVVVDQYYRSVRPRPRAVESPTLGANSQHSGSRKSCISWLGTTPRRAKSFVVAIWIASVIFIIPQFSPFVDTVPYFIIYDTTLEILFMILPPFTLTLIYLCRTVITDHKSIYCCANDVIHSSTSGPPKSKSSLNSSVVSTPHVTDPRRSLDVSVVVERRPIVGTHLVTILGLMFLLCRLPSLVMYSIDTVNKTRRTFSETEMFSEGASFSYLLTLSNFLVVLNSATRFLQYFYVKCKWSIS